jgi:hypothetical protein
MVERRLSLQRACLLSGRHPAFDMASVKVR